MSVVHVAVAAITNPDNQVLIALRPGHVHQGGKWEFPGGKVEQGETVLQALTRELYEEIGITIISATPLIKVEHQYTDKTVVLDVWRIQQYEGDPVGAEGQLIQWKDIDQLNVDDFPAANIAIIRTLNLPHRYMITGDFSEHENFISYLVEALENNIKLVQLRCKNNHEDEYKILADSAKVLCHQYGAKLLLNTTLDMFNKIDADGLHLSSYCLSNYRSRPISENKILSVSCHNEDEIEQAKQLNADIVLLSPVKKTASHPDMDGIGWDGFSILLSQVSCPVYALGGMAENDMGKAISLGAQGIAAISCFWPNEK